MGGEFGPLCLEIFSFFPPFFLFSFSCSQFLSVRLVSCALVCRRAGVLVCRRHSSAWRCGSLAPSSAQWRLRSLPLPASAAASHRRTPGGVSVAVLQRVPMPMERCRGGFSGWQLWTHWDATHRDSDSYPPPPSAHCPCVWRSPYPSIRVCASFVASHRTAHCRSPHTAHCALVDRRPQFRSAAQQSLSSP